MRATGRQHNIDVTGRLKELARRDDRVRVTNGLFGDDPDVGRSKVLRIYARNRDGGTRVFEFRETGECHQLMRENLHPSGNMSILVNAPRRGLKNLAETRAAR